MINKGIGILLIIAFSYYLIRLMKDRFNNKISSLVLIYGIGAVFFAYLFALLLLLDKITIDMLF